MSVKIRPYVNGGWEVDIRLLRPDGTVFRERKKAPVASRSGAQRWGEAHERALLSSDALCAKAGKEEGEEALRVPTLREFAPRFLDGYAKANRLKPSGIAGKETILRVHLVRLLGDKTLDAITTEDVQRLKSAMSERSPKTVNNVLTVLSVLLRTAVEWQVMERVPCSVKLLKIVKGKAGYHDFDEYERLVKAARADSPTYLVVLLGGEAGLRCGEIMALEWANLDIAKRQICVERSEWKGQVTAPKGGRIRHVPMTRRLADALKEARHLRGPRVLCDEEGHPLTQKVVQMMVRRAARRANVRHGVHILRHTFCSHLAMRGAPARAIQELAGHQDLSTTLGYMHLSPAALSAAIRLLDGDEPSGGRLGRGEIVEAAGTEG